MTTCHHQHLALRPYKKVGGFKNPIIFHYLFWLKEAEHAKSRRARKTRDNTSLQTAFLTCVQALTCFTYTSHSSKHLILLESVGFAAKLACHLRTTHPLKHCFVLAGGDNNFRC